MKTHEHFIEKCITLARKGNLNVSPNPMVGCIIVYNDEIIGEGYHQEYGKSHAEVNAIKAVKDKSLLVNLHYMLIWNLVVTMAKHHRVLI